MLSALISRIRGQWPIFALGLATPMLAIGALLVQSDHGADLEQVSSSQAMLPHLAAGASAPAEPTQSRQYRPLDPIETTTTMPAEPDSVSETTAPTSSGSDTTAVPPSRAGSTGRTTTTVRKKTPTSGSKPSGSSGGSPGGSSTGSGSSGGATSGGNSGANSGGSSGGGTSGGGSSGGSGGGVSPTTTAPGPSADLLNDDFGGWAGSILHTGDTAGPWRVRSDGGGQIGGSGRMTLAPLADDGSSHVAWVSTAASFGNLDLRVDVTTTAQLHSTPGDDDAARIVFHGATGNDGYVLVLGTTSSRLDQVTGGSSVTLDSSGLGVGLGSAAAVRVIMTGTHIDVWIGFSHVLSVVDTSPLAAGPIGFGAVNANVNVDNVVVRDA